MLEDLENALAAFEGGHWALWERVQNKLLHAGLLDAVRRESRGEDTSSALATCCALLTASGSSERIASFYKRHSDYRGSEVDADRVWRNACALSATARAAVAAIRAEREKKEGLEDELAQRWREAVCALQANISLPEMRFRWNWPQDALRTAIDLLECAYERLPSAHYRLRAALEWSRWWLEQIERAAENRRAEGTRVPVAGVLEEGFVTDLELHKLPNSPPELIDDPLFALRPCGATMIQTLRDIHSRYPLVVRWAMIPRDAAIPDNAPLDGPSLGGAVEVRMRLLAKDLPYDSDCIVLAQVFADGRLRDVGGEEQKLAAAKAKGVRRAVLAAVLNNPDRRRSLEQAAAGMDVVYCTTIQEAEDAASGLASGLAAYYKTAARPDAGLPAYMGGRTTASVYVWPDVLAREKHRSRFDGPDQTGYGDKRKEPPRPTMGPAAMDVDEEGMYGESLREYERRAPWANERQLLESPSGGYRWAVVLGPPGQGKSELLYMTHEAIKTEARASLMEQKAPVSELPLPVFMTFADFTASEALLPEDALREAMRTAVGRSMPAGPAANRVANYIGKCAHESRVWLFVDALDELPEGRATRLAALLGVLARWECRVVMTSRPYAWGDGKLSPEAREYRLAEFTSLQAREFVGKWFAQAEARRSELEERLTTDYSLQQLSQNPFLLTLVCWLAERGRLPREVTRTEIYERIVPDLLGLPREPGAQVNETRAQELLPMMRAVGLAWFRSTKGKGIEAGVLLEAMRRNQCPWPLGKIPADLNATERAGLVRDELCEKRVLVPGPARKEYFAPHRSIVEFLAASELASGMASADETERERAWRTASRKSWDPEWEQVILFLAGSLNEQPANLKRFIQALADDKTDDIVHWRLLLATKCLAEPRTEAVQRLGPMAAAVLDRTHSWWAMMRTPAPDSALPALAAADAKAGGGPITRLAGELRSPEHDVRRAAATALGRLGFAAARADVIDGLIELSRDPTRWVRLEAVSALGDLAPSAARADVADRLVECYGDLESQVRVAAADALRKMEPVAADAEEVDRLVRELRHPVQILRCGAASRLGRLGTAAARPDIIDQLLECLRDPEPDLRRTAARALGQMGAVAARADVGDRLCGLLHDSRMDVSAAAEEALGQIGALSPADTLDRLVELLRGPDRHIQFEAVRALGRMGSAAARADIVDCVGEWLRDPKPYMRSAAAWALGEMGAAAARADIVGRLGELLGDPDREVRHAVAWALRGMGPAAAHAEILDRLREWLRDPDWGVRRAAATALGQMEVAAARADIVDGLGGLMRDSLWEVRHAAAAALGQMGAAAVRPDLADRLTELLRDPGSEVRHAAAHALERMAKDGIRVFRKWGKTIIKTIPELSGD